MGQQVYKISRISDKQIAQALNTLAKEFGDFTAGIVIFDHSIGQISFPDPKEEIWQRIIENDADLIHHFGINANNTIFNYYRGGNQGNVWQKSPSIDDLLIDSRNVEANTIAFVTRILDLFRPVQIPESTGPQELLETQRALQEATFGRLQHQLEQVFQQTINLREQLDMRVQAKELALEADFRQRKEQADAELLAQKSALEVEKAEIEARRKDIDDSDNTTARRKIRDQLLTDVQSRVQQFGVSRTTLRSRLPVAAGMGFLVIFLLCVFGWTTKELVDHRAAMSKFSEITSTLPTVKLAEGETPEKQAAYKEEMARQVALQEAAKTEL